MPCYNCLRWLQETLDSLSAQTFTDFTVVFIDDGSAIPVKLEDLETMYKGDIRLFRHRKNMGLSAARNTGVMIAKASRFVIFLDPDDIIEPTAFEKLLLKASYNEDERCAFIYPGVRNFRVNEALNSTEIISVDLTPYSRSALLRSNFITSFALISREVYVRAGGMCEHRIRWWEDYDFWLRLANLGFHGELLGDPIFWYRRHNVGRSSYIATNIREELWRRELEVNNPSDLPDIDDDVRELVEKTQVPPCYYQLDDSKWNILSRLNTFASYLYRRHEPISSFKALRGYKPENALPISSTPIPMKHEAAIMFVIPWMQIGGADFYDLNIIEGLSSSFNILIVTGIDVKQHKALDLFKRFTNDIFMLPTLIDPLSDNVDNLNYEMLLHLVRTRNVKHIYCRNSFAGYNFMKHLVDNGMKEDIKFYDVQHLYTLKDRGGWEYTTIPYHSYIDTRVVVSNDLLQRQVKLLGGAGQEKFRVIPPGIDFDIWTAPISSCKAQLNEWTILFIGRVDEQKDPLKWIRLAATIHQALPSIKFIVIGDGPLLGQMKADAQKLDVPVEFSSRFLSSGEIARLLATGSLISSDSCRKSLLMMTSQNEGLPIVILEALAASVPVISPPVGAISEIKANGQLHLVESHDDAAFLRKVMQIMGSSLRRIDIPTCHKDFYNSYSRDTFIQRYSAVFNNKL